MKYSMKKLQQCVTAVILGTLGAVNCANAQDSTTTTTTMQSTAPDKLPDSDLYRAQEFSVDLFGSGAIDQHTIDHFSGNRVLHNGVLGGGGGINYFFTRYIGIGGDAYVEHPDHDYIETPSGNLILRIPILDTGLAPYVFGGGGYQFSETEAGQDFAQGGGGVEFRFEKDFGLFVDGRYVFTDKTQNYAVVRAGIRLNF
jgi:hypothetical protein